MMQYFTIANDEDNILLSCLINTNGEKCMISLEFKEIKSKEFPTLSLSWDNDNYIFGKFYKFLKRWRKKKIKKKDGDEFNDIWHLLNDDVVNELIEMLELALKDNWYIIKNK